MRRKAVRAGHSHIQNTDLGSATRSKLLTFFDDPVKRRYLDVQAAVTVDAGMFFVLSATQSKLLPFFDVPVKRSYLEMQTAITVGAGMHFVKIHLCPKRR